VSQGSSRVVPGEYQATAQILGEEVLKIRIMKGSELSGNRF